MEKAKSCKRNRKKQYSTKYCNNCNLDGHNYKDCPEPIISYGIICYKKNTSTGINEYLVIKRLNSYAFTEFIRGRYNQDDLPYIKMMLSRMAQTEHDYMRSLSFETMWSRLWKQNIIKHCKEYDTCKNIFDIMVNDKNLFDLLDEIKTQYQDSEWGFPKGKRNNKELAVDCAKREFHEESGVPLSMIRMDTLDTVVEEYTNVTNKTYRSVYYIAEYIGDHNIELKVEQSNVQQCTEIEDIRWATFEDTVSLFRPYYTQKIDCITSVHSKLNIE